MLKTMTWNHYWTCAAILAGLWYLIILLAYYRKQIFKIISGEYQFPKKTAQAVADMQPEAQVQNPGKEKETYALEEAAIDELSGITQDIKKSILEVADDTVSKEELLRQIQYRLANYDGLRQDAFRYALNNFLIREAQEICGVSFSEEELNAAWEKLPR